LQGGRAGLDAAAVGREWSTYTGPPREPRPFIFGNILFANRVQSGDTVNPQWNDPNFIDDVGLSVYPPYAEASGYALSASLAKFLATAASSNSLSWKVGWAVEDSTFGMVLAGLSLSWVQMPWEIRSRVRVVKTRPSDG
jgi:hypothetical protein